MYAPDRRAQLSTTRAFARALAGLDPESLPAEVVDKARLCLLDLLASAFTSRHLPWALQAIEAATGGTGGRRAADATGGVPIATIIGSTLRAPLTEAAFANAVLGHGLVRDDMHLGSVSHLGAAVIPPLLALAESGHYTGRALVAGVVAGYEAGAKLGRAILDVEVSRVFRPTGITGPFAGAAAGARLLGMDESRFAAALGLAANAAAGYNEWAATGGSEMFFHPGFGARNAITSLRLASAGAHVSETAVDGRAGMLAAFGKAGDAVPLPFDRAPEILNVFFKEVPACNFAQAAAQAARALSAREDVDRTEIASIEVRVPYAAAAYPGCDAPGPLEHTLQAKMSIQYNVAAALLTGTFDEANYVPARQTAITELAPRVSLRVDDELTRAYPARQAAEVVVMLRGGGTLRHAVADVVPASEGLVRERFVDAACEALGPARARALLDCVESLETLDDAGELARLTRTQGD